MCIQSSHEYSLLNAMLLSFVLLAIAAFACPLCQPLYPHQKRQTIIPGDDGAVIFSQTHITPASTSGQSIAVSGLVILGVETFLGIPFGEPRKFVSWFLSDTSHWREQIRAPPRQGLRPSD